MYQFLSHQHDLIGENNVQSMWVNVCAKEGLLAVHLDVAMCSLG